MIDYILLQTYILPAESTNITDMTISITIDNWGLRQCDSFDRMSITIDLL